MFGYVNLDKQSLNIGKYSYDIKKSEMHIRKSHSQKNTDSPLSQKVGGKRRYNLRPNLSCEEYLNTSVVFLLRKCDKNRKSSIKISFILILLEIIKSVYDMSANHI